MGNCMSNYYKILELTPDAEPQDIKKSYFRLIRKYPPDKEPKKFQEIREAYEYLQQENNREELKRIYNIPSPFCEVYQYARAYESRGDLKQAIATCKEGLRIDTGQKELNLFLAGLYMKNEEAGKAIKLLESLSSRFKNDLSWNSLLARAYDKRGWVKKALLQYELAYRMGNKETDFLLAFAANNLRQDYYINARELLLEILKREQESDHPDIYTVIRVFSLLFISDMQYEPIDLPADIKIHQSFFEYKKLSLNNQKMLTIDVLGFVMAAYDQNTHDTDVLDYLTGAVSFEEPVNYTQDEMDILHMALCKMEKVKITKDTRLDIEIREAAVEFLLKSLLSEEEYEFDEESIDLDILGSKLLIIDAMPGIKMQLDIIKEEYPNVSKEMAEFIEELELNNNLAYLKSKYEKKYCKLAGFPSNTRLVRNTKYTEQDYGEEESEYSFYQEPYKREEPKIGRNDPCGSGKKYKKCCGR
ncbi:MAG: DnaJ domain-containing protein [Anaerocolumna sp.]